MKSLRIAFLLPLTLLSCTPPSTPCTSTPDCPSTEVCIQGQCRAGNRTGGGPGGVGGGSDTGGNGGSNTGGGTGLSEPDAGTNPDYDGGCGPLMPGNPSIRRRCAAATSNECDGMTDSSLTTGNVPSSRLNGQSGNGFDDDCDGQVDEGCFCPANGVTKDCYLVPATQVSDATGLPVGWCAANAKGSLDCSGGGELASWSGVCRGAQPPALNDSCSPGDYNCDGLSGNNAVEGCLCASNVQCPSAAVTVSPYPTPTAIPVIDGSQWITDATARSRTTGWSWTVLGGDCDNVLPNPTFALYRQTNSTLPGTRVGSRAPVRLDTTQNPARYAPQAGSPLIAIRATAYGNGITGGQVFPAFGLSGDYIVQGEFTLDGRSYSCTQKVQVRAPGIRAELCWDSVGNAQTGGNDIDLHFARLQGLTCPSQGWSSSCANSDGSIQDCSYTSASGCVSDSFQGPRWGYPNSANTACLGWSSKRDPRGAQLCTNPRLDRDNITCDRSKIDPTDGDFCGPENINLDNPNNNDTFVVGVNHYGNSGGSANAKPHVNLYCNGERVVSVGYNPATGQNSFPLLNTPGADSDGDFWTVATIKANVVGGNLASCTVTGVPSRQVDATRDGPAQSGGTGNDICVDHAYNSKAFVETPGQGLPGGSQPTNATQWCKH